MAMWMNLAQVEKRIDEITLSARAVSEAREARGEPSEIPMAAPASEAPSQKTD